MLFSATMPDWVAKTAAKHLRNPVTVQVDANVHAPPTVEHLIYSIKRHDKLGALRTLLMIEEMRRSSFLDGPSTV